MSYYETQLDTKQAVEFFVQELNEALSNFPGANLIPVNLDVWDLDKYYKMKQVFRVNDYYYFVALCTQVEKRYVMDNGRKVEGIYSRQIQVRRLENLEIPDLLQEKIFFGSVANTEVVYEGKKFYCCPKPSCVRNLVHGGSLDYFEQNIWYFNDIETPNEIIEKIISRATVDNNIYTGLIFTLKLKRTPFKGFKKDVIYKKYENGAWSLTNRNGREVTAYDLIK